MKKRLSFSLVAVIACLIALAPSAHAQEDKKKDETKKDAVKTHKVEAGFFEVVEEVSAVVESKNMTPLSMDLDSWSTLKIKKIADEGTSVKAGDEIVWFDTEKIDRNIRDGEFALLQSQFALDSAKLELDLLNKTYELDVAMAEREMKQASDDYNYFVEVERPNREKSTARSLESSQHALEYAQEEYNQLKRMYEEDELTEESEEIILKRTQRDVESRQFYLGQTQIRTDRALNVDIPRDAVRKKESLERAKMEYERTKIKMPMEREQKKVATQKSEMALNHQREDHQKLVADRMKMTVKAPVDGVLYFGRCEKGKWMGQAGTSRELSEGKSVMPNKVMATIVDVNNLMLRTELSEKQLGLIKPSAQGVAKPKAFPNKAVAATVKSVNYVPAAADKFDCQMDLASNPAGLMPGMSCKVRFVVRSNPAALTVPTSAIFTDDGMTHYVFMQGGEKRQVSVGLESNSKTEILDGLKAGEEVLTKRPSS